MAVATNAYPAPRVKRAGGSPAAAAAYVQPPPPRSRVFSFAIQVGANNQRSSTSSPLLKGPAVVNGFHVSKNGAAAGGLGFGLGKSLSPVSESSVATSLDPPFEALTQGLPQIGAPPTAPNGADVILDVQPSLLVDDDSIDILIMEPEFYLVVYCAAGAAGGGQSILGHVNLTEQVSPQVVANFR